MNPTKQMEVKTNLKTCLRGGRRGHHYTCNLTQGTLRIPLKNGR
jgi:hypothetical protein